MEGTAPASTGKRKNKKGKKKASAGVADSDGHLTVDTQSTAGDSDVSELDPPDTPRSNGIDPTKLRSESKSPLIDAILQKELQTERAKNKALEEELAKLRLEKEDSAERESQSKSNSEDIERLQGQLDDALKKLADAKEQAESAKKEASRMKALEEELAKTRKECDVSNAEIESVRKEVGEEKRKSEELAKQLKAREVALETSLNEEKRKNEELAKQLKARDSDLETSRKDLQKATSSSSASTSNLETKLLECQQERDEARTALTKAEEDKKNIEAQYRNLLDRVGTIKATIGEKMKADAAELEETKGMVADLEDQNKELETVNAELESSIKDLNSQVERLDRELGNLRSRMNLAQANWTRERDDLANREKRLREEYDAATQAMRDWETIATEERGVRTDLSEKVAELEEQLEGTRLSYEKLVDQRDKDAQLIEGLQRNVHELQEARRTELKDMQAATESQIAALNSKAALFETKAREAEAQLGKLQDELQRLAPFEKEVKEKSLLIGKLRHEAVTLNDHLTKALRMLKKGNASDNVDKQLVTNVFLSFLTIQRGDTKKYEILQLIASVLDWSDEQRERAGLVRPGTSSLKIPTPTSPGLAGGGAFSRSPSSSTLGDAYDGSRDVWTSVLEGGSNNN